MPSLQKTLGLRVKSGYAIAIVVSGVVGDAKAFKVERRAEIPLTDNSEHGRFPYHPLIDLPGDEGVTASRRAVQTVQSVAQKELATFLESVGKIRSATIIVGSLIDPDDISNPHIRVHAREGELFRTVIAKALDRAGIEYRLLREKDVYKEAATKLHCPEAQLRKEVDGAGKKIVKPWRADEKSATAGALLLA